MDSTVTTKQSRGGPVLFYEGAHYYCSNFSAFQVKWRGRLWPTSEHAYQVAKFFGVAEDVVGRIFAARSAHEALGIARENEARIRPDWNEDVRIETMFEIVLAKHDQHAFIQEKLRETGTRRLIESSHKDGFWGWGADGNGRNELGKIWMRIRDRVSPEAE